MATRFQPLLAVAIIAFAAMPVFATDTALGARLAADGDAGRGIDACANCHQADGGGSEDVGAPRLAAMGGSYLAAQIYNFKNGNRKHPVMEPWAELLTDDEISSVTAYYEELPPVSHAKVPVGGDPKAGETLALYGDWPGRRLPGCVQCHGPLGVGVGESFPALAGQPYNYLVGQLAAWTAGERKGDPLGMMASVNARLSVPESQAVAAYFASLPASSSLRVAARIDRGEVAPEAVVTQQQAVMAPVPDGSEALPAHQGEVLSGREPGKNGHFQPPARGDKPEKQFGEMVELGESIFSHTYSHVISGKYVGNNQVCEGCHLDAGRLADSAPMWGAWVAYPAYRGKNRQVNTMIERIQGCFTYSMNAPASAAGRPPAAESTTIHALLSYMYWLATGAPTGDKSMPGRGYPKLAETEQGFDPARGAAVYSEQCAICHGAQGQGGWADNEMVFPPLWGGQSYNWGAGMHKIDTAAAFIKANMPFGHPVELTDQQAWDVAAFINSNERPQDPRFTGDLAATTEQFHGSQFDYYGRRKGPDGQLLGDP